MRRYGLRAASRPTHSTAAADRCPGGGGGSAPQTSPTGDPHPQVIEKLTGSGRTWNIARERLAPAAISRASFARIGSSTMS